MNYQTREFSCHVFLLLVGCMACSDTQGADGLARLRLDNGQFVDGHVANAPPGEFGWQSPHFDAPLRFELPLINSIDFKQPASPDKEAGEFIFSLASGIRLAGDLANIDERTVELRSKLFGQLIVERTQLRQIERRDRSSQLVYEGPNSLEDWTSSPPNAWLFEAGSLQSNSNGINIRGDVAIPEKCRIELRLGWDAKPSFVLAFGLDKNAGADNFAAARLEVWDSQLTLVRESGRHADIAILSQLADREDHIELTMFLDQKTGEVAVHSASGELLEKLIVPFEKPTESEDVLLVNNGSRLRLEKLNVYHWDGTPPDFTDQSGAYVVTKDRKSVAGTIIAFDSSIQQVRIQGETETSLDLAQVSRMVFASTGGSTKPSDADRDPNLQQPSKAQDAATKSSTSSDSPSYAPNSAIEVRLRDGSRLLGKWIAVDAQQQVHFEPIGLGRELTFAAVQLATIMRPRDRTTAATSKLADPFSKSAAISDGRTGLITGDHVKLSGRLITGQDTANSSPLWWLADVGQGAVPVNLNSSGTIDYMRAGIPLSSTVFPSTSTVVVRPGNPAPMILRFPNARTSRPVERPVVMKPLKQGLVFRTGDRIDGEVERIDDRGVYFKSSMTQKGFARHDQMQSMVLANVMRAPQLSEEKLARLLTVPRISKNDPPTHLLIASNGDYLRGRLLRLDEHNATVEVRLEEVQLPRKAIIQIIWLHDHNWPDPKSSTAAKENSASADAPATDKPQAAGPTNLNAPTTTSSTSAAINNIHAIDSKGGSVTFSPTAMRESRIFGNSELLGDCSIAVSDLNSILFGPDVASRALVLQKESWKLSLARNPKVFDEQESGEPGSVPASQRSPLVGKPAPDFSLQDLAGNTFQLSQNKGRVIVLDFWASWCGPCIQTMPEVDRVVTELGNNQVDLVAVNLQETADRARSAMERLKLSPTVVLDTDGEVAQYYDAQAIPQTVIVDRAGVIRHLFVGGGAKFIASFSAALKATLDETAQQP